MNETLWTGAAINLGLLLAFLALGALFIITLQNTLKSIEPVNRTMQPGQIWFLFIPIFNIYWVFRVIAAIADSTKNQMEVYGVYKEGRPAYTLGTFWAVSILCNRLPYIGGFFAIVSLILWIAYWIKVSQLKKELLSFREIYRFREEDSVL